MVTKAVYVNKWYVPECCQFEGKDVFIEATKGRSINWFGPLSRNNKLIYRIAEQYINANFIIEQLEHLSLSI